MDQTKGEKKSGPHTNDEENDLLCQINNASISADKNINHTLRVAKCPKVCISAHGIHIPSLLDSGSEVTLLQQPYFEKYILPKIKLAVGEKANAYSLFSYQWWEDANKMTIKLDLTFLGLTVSSVGMLIAEEMNQVVEKEHQTKLCGCCDIVNVNNWVVAMRTSYAALLTSANHSPLLEGAHSVYEHAHIVNYSDFIS